MRPSKGAVPIVGVDLFCGVGGLTHGLIQGGIKMAAGVDIDPTCRYPFESNNSAVFIESDVASLSPKAIADHLKGGKRTLIAGCAPCQPFSTYSRSGRNRNHSQQWSLVLTFGKLVEIIQPDLVTMENVPQLADHSVFEQFLNHLAGYQVWWGVIECSQVGIPQTRRRLVLLASRSKASKLELCYTSAPMPTVRQTIADLPALKAGESDPLDRIHVASRLSELNLSRIRASRPGGTWRDWPSGLQANCHLKLSGATYPSVYGRMEWDKPAPTITTQCFGYGNGRFGHPEQDRALSLREAAMLQTFPRDYAFAAPNSPVRFNRLGRHIGNAVPVRLGEVIAESLLKHVDRSKGSPTP